MSTSAPIPPSPAAAHPRPGDQPIPNLPFRGDPAKQGREVSQARTISARNATTHGLFARDVVLPALGEDPAAFDALLEQLIAQLPPRNLLERHYLEQIAAASWRLRRLHRWQAQVWEDSALTEDQRLDKLDRTMRQETMLTRQIDRAVRLLHRDLTDLFAVRARDEALRDYDVTEADCRTDPHLAADIQRRVWQERDRAGADPDLHGAHLDTVPPIPDDDGLSDTQKCENEPPPLSVAAIVQENLQQRIPPADTATPPLPLPLVPPAAPSTADVDDPEEYEDPDDYPFVDERYRRPDSNPPLREICENEICENEIAGKSITNEERPNGKGDDANEC